MIFARYTVPTAARRMRVGISIVVVPDRAHVARIGLEQEAGRGVDPNRLDAADRAKRRHGRLVHWALAVVARCAFGTPIFISGHAPLLRE